MSAAAACGHPDEVTVEAAPATLAGSTDSTRRRPLSPLAQAAASCAVAAGLLALAGWATGLLFLASFVPDGLTMKVNTAVSFVAAGAAILLLAGPVSPGRRRLAALLAVAVGALALVVGAQDVTGIAFGIDQLLAAEPPGTPGTLRPGRMSPQTALAFVATAAAILVVHRPRMASLVAVLVLVPILLGALNVLDVVLGAETPTFLVGYTAMALPTALAFPVLGVALLDLLPGNPVSAFLRDPAPLAALTRRLTIVAAAVPLALGWIRLEGERRGLYDSAYGVALFVLATIVLFVGAIVVGTRALRRVEMARDQAAAAREAALAEASDLYENAPCGYHSLDGEGRFVRINETECRWLGYTKEELVGRARMTDLLTPASAERFRREFPAFRERGFVSDLEFDLVRKDGTILPVLLSATAVRDADGQYVMSRSTLIDLTARREADRAREAARDAAESASQAKSEFLSRMSHELRTPLNSILGFGQLLAMDSLKDDQRESVAYIRRAGEHLLELINEVLDISRIEAGKLTLSPEPVHVGELLGEVVGLVAPLADGGRITIDASDAACAAHILADHQRIRQVLLNLLGNAVKYNRHGGTVAVRCASVDGRRLRISISDTGYGIAPDRRDRLFVPFERLGAEETVVQGTGIGLALAKGLVEAMGGSIGVDSVVDQGSTFWIELDVVEAPQPRRERRRAAAPAAVAVDRPVRRLLYIEDNVANVRLVERILGRRPGIRLDTATHGQRGLELALERRPDLVLLDLHLPDLPGGDVLQRLRTHPATRDVPVVVISADATKGQMRRLLDAGAAGYLTKPLDVEAFLAEVDRHLAAAESSAPS